MRRATRYLPAAAACAALCVACGAGALADPSPSPSPPPPAVPPAPYLSVEQVNTPSYDGATGSGMQTNVRGQFTFLAGLPWVLRFKLPFVESSPSTSNTGTGDLSLYLMAFAPAGRGSWLEGVTLRVPTGQKDSLGSGKYSAGPAFGYTETAGGRTTGFFTDSYFSVAGPSSRNGVGKSKIRPILLYPLGAGWQIGASTMNFTYDWIANRWTKVPLGVAILRSFGGPSQPFDAKFEAEDNLVAAPGNPRLTFRLLLKYTFPRT